VDDEQAEAVRADYPPILKPGFLPLSKLKVHGWFEELVHDLQSPQLARILSEKLSIDLTDKARTTMVRKLSKAGDGRIHNGHVREACTMFIYLNDNWDLAEGGAIRALNGSQDIEDFAEEISPIAGNVFAFVHSGSSWHGHLPFEGERYVVQTTFLTYSGEEGAGEDQAGLRGLFSKLNPFGPRN
ncbi:MAG: 2OG-Fe(II) oxygenase, partial [Pseudomonadota bacterium]